MKNKYLLMAKKDRQKNLNKHLEKLDEAEAFSVNNDTIFEWSLVREGAMHSINKSAILAIQGGKNTKKTAQALCSIESEIKRSLQDSYFIIPLMLDSSLFFERKMYEKFAEVELKLREILLRVLTRSYGSMWTYNFFQKEIQEDLAKKTRGAPNSAQFHENVIHSLDFSDLIYYLFFAYPDKNAEFLFDLTLLPSCFAEKTEDEIKEILEPYTPRSCWDRINEYDNEIDIEIERKELLDFKNYRNMFAHYHVVTNKDYDSFLRLRRKLISDIDSAQGILDLQPVDMSVLFESFTSVGKRLTEITSPLEGMGIAAAITSAATAINNAVGANALLSAQAIASSQSAMGSLLNGINAGNIASESIASSLRSITQIDMGVGESYKTAMQGITGGILANNKVLSAQLSYIHEAAGLASMTSSLLSKQIGTSIGLATEATKAAKDFGSLLPKVSLLATSINDNAAESGLS